MRHTDSSHDVELWTYRVVCLLGALSLPLSALLFQRLDPGLVDPLWLRLGLGALPMVLFVASFLSEQVRRELGGLATVLLYVLVAWFSSIALINDLPAEYAVGGMVLIVAVGVVSGAGSARLRTLGLALATAAAAMIFVTFYVAEPGIDRYIFSGAVLAAAVTLYAGTWTQRRLRRRLLASEERYRTVLERVADGVALADPRSLRIIASNAAYRRITGFREQELTSRSLINLLVNGPDDLDGHVRRALREGAVDLGQCAHLRRDGSKVEVDIGLSRVTDENGELCLTLRDLTEENRVRAQSELARDQAQAMLELRTAFLNNMSHEIRTPLVSLTGFLKIMEEEHETIAAAERADMITSLRRSADRLNETLNAVLDLAQIESGQYELKVEPVDINTEAERAARLIEGDARAKGLDVQLQGCEPARILVDRNALHRILLNLYSNAVKFTPSGAVTIAAEADSHRVLLHVRDTGVGIDPAFVPHLFGAFRQESTGLAREHEGSGLGLTIVKRLLDQMGGRIRVHSEPGEGTCITLAFARTWATAAEPGGQPLEPGAHDGGDGASEHADPAWNAAPAVEPLAPRPRALIVEDNADTARLMHRLLRDVVDVDVAPTGDAALQRAATAWYDVLLIDTHLGAGMDGATLLNRLRAISAYAHVPAVATSTSATPGEREHYKSAGFDAFLPKPFTKTQLLKAVDQAHAARAMASS